MKLFHADLHLHTCLSPCGDLDMHPAEIVRCAAGAGLDVIAICDHNTAGNARATMDAAAGLGLAVIPGIEICTVEEVHVVALLPDTEAAATLQRECLAGIRAENDPDLFGPQVIVDAQGGVDGFELRMLLSATSFSLEQAAARIRSLGGLVILAHVDREAFGILGQLGFIPPGLDFDAAEVTSAGALGDVAAALPPGKPVIATSDAHFIHEIGQRRTLIQAPDTAFESLARALRAGNLSPVFP